MFETVNVGVLVRNFGIYAIGVGLAVAGALGLAGAVELLSALAALLFVVGLVLVLVVHEYLGGPV